MYAYLLQTGRLILPFQRPVGEMKVHNVPLAEHQRGCLERLGFQVHVIERLEQVATFPALVLDDDLFFTRTALARFVRSAARCDAGSRAALRRSPLTEHMASAFQGDVVADQDGTIHRGYGCYFLRQLDLSQALDQQTQLMPIRHRVGRLSLRTTRQLEPSRRYVVPISRAYLTPVRHWACLVAANIMALPDFFFGMLRNRPLSCATLPLSMLIRSGSLRPNQLLGKLYLAGRRCRVHPTAHVEAAVLGDRVRIGPHAVVRNCVLGDHTEIRAGANVEGTTLGRNVIVEPGSVVRGCVAEDGVSLGTHFVQLSVFGRDTVVCPAALLADFLLRGTVRVEWEGKKVASGSRFLGVCTGDNAFLGPLVQLSCGAEIPNGCQLIGDPRQTISDMSGELPENIIRIDRGRKRRPAA